MEKYVILADITCDLPKEIRDYIGMTDYIKGHFSITEGGKTVDYISELGWDNIDRDYYYGLLDSTKAKVTTAPPNIEEYASIFEKYINDGYAVLSMSLSAKISSTYDQSCVAARKVKESHPDAKIYCFDSSRMSGAFGLLTMYAHILKNEGKSFDEVVEWLEANKNRLHQMGPIDDLIVIARRGRIAMGKAIMGSFAGVKPMGDCNSDGYVTVLTKAKGMRKALELTVGYIEKTAVDPANNYAIITHTDRAKYASDLESKLQSVGFKKVFVIEAMPGNATNIGCGMIGVYYFGNPISEDMAAEKAIMAELTAK